MPTDGGELAPYIPLPAATAGERVRREDTRLTFDRVADLYDRSRPGYPEEMFAELRAGPLRPGASVLEVGCGTGQATVSLAPSAGRVTCLELGPALGARAERNLAEFPNVTVVVGPFEEVDLPAGTFDLVFAATAWHWVDPTVGYARAATALAGGGTLALATNAHVAGGTQMEIAEEVAALQARVCPEIGSWQFPSAAAVTAAAQAGGTIADVWSRIDRRFEATPPVQAIFDDPVVSVFEWSAGYSARGYAEMLATQSSYIALDGTRRRQLLEGIVALVDEHLDGQVTKAYIAVLAVAARRAG